MITEYSFGAWLRQRRTAVRLTRVALAAQIGCTATTLAKIERDERRPSPRLAARLADALISSSATRQIFLRAARAELAVDHLPLPIEEAHQMLDAIRDGADTDLIALLVSILHDHGVGVAPLMEPPRILAVDVPDNSLVAVICLMQRSTYSAPETI